MSHQSDLISEDILAYLAQHERKELLRFLTCGNVDDGKSTLIGRLLHDSKMIYEDHLEAITRDSKKVGTTGDEVDLALLVDGLQAEREQGITIDVAYRYFSTAKRKFIIADTPGHEQYTRNMATGASTCDLAIILIDARHGVQQQTRRHSFIVSLLGIKHVVVAINKMDLVGWSEQQFEAIKKDYLAFAKKIDVPDITFIPLSYQTGNTKLVPRQTPPTDDLRTIAASRLLLDNFPHIEAYWVMLGEATASLALHFGASDVNGTLEDEKIAHMAQAASPAGLATEQILRIVRDAGKIAVERDALYNVVKVWN